MDLRRRSKRRGPRKRGIVSDTYSYHDVAGKLVFRKQRHQPKGFSYVWPGRARSSPPKLLYRLPELLAADPSETVFLVEGEKDVDRLRSLGLVATCTPDGGGQGKWDASYNRHFRGRRVVILPDNDEPGRDYASEIACSVSRTATEVKVIELPGLPDKGDVSDWLDAGATVEELMCLADKCEPYRIPTKLTFGDSCYDGEWEYGAMTFFSAMEAILNRDDLTAQEKLLLIINAAGISSPEPTQQTLARCLSLSVPRVKQIVASLKSKGAIDTSPRPADRRSRKYQQR